MELDFQHYSQRKINGTKYNKIKEKYLCYIPDQIGLQWVECGLYGAASPVKLVAQPLSFSILNQSRRSNTGSTPDPDVPHSEWRQVSYQWESPKNNNNN